MRISRLLSKIFKLAQLSEKAKAKILETFRNRHAKLNLEFDEDKALRIIEAWDKARRSPKTKDLVKANIYDYRTLDDVLSDVERTGIRLDTKYLSEILSSYEFLREGNLVAYLFKEGEYRALSLSAKGSDWCIRNPETALDYLNGGDFVVVRSYSEDDKEGKPLYAFYIQDIDNIQVFDAADTKILDINVDDVEVFGKRVEPYRVYDVPLESLISKGNVLERGLETVVNNIDMLRETVLSFDKNDPAFETKVFDAIYSGIGNALDNLREAGFSLPVTTEFANRLLEELSDYYGLTESSQGGIKLLFAEILSRSVDSLDKETAKNIVDNYFLKISSLYSQVLDVLVESKVAGQSPGYLVRRLERFSTTLFSFLRKLSSVLQDDSIYSKLVSTIHPLEYPYLSRVWKVGVINDFEDKYKEALLKMKEIAARHFYESYLSNIIINRRALGYELNKLNSGYYGDLNKIFFGIYSKKLSEIITQKASDVVTSYIYDNIVPIVEDLDPESLESFDNSEYGPLLIDSLLFIKDTRVSDLAFFSFYALALRNGVSQEEALQWMINTSLELFKKSYNIVKYSNKGIFKSDAFFDQISLNLIADNFRETRDILSIFLKYNSLSTVNAYEIESEIGPVEIPDYELYNAIYLLRSGLLNILYEGQDQKEVLKRLAKAAFFDMHEVVLPSELSRRLKALFSLAGSLFDLKKFYEDEEMAIEEYKDLLLEVTNTVLEEGKEIFRNHPYLLPPIVTYLKNLGHELDKALEETTEYKTNFEEELVNTISEPMRSFMRELYPERTGLINVLRKSSMEDIKESLGEWADLTIYSERSYLNPSKLEKILATFFEVYGEDTKESEMISKLLGEYAKNPYLFSYEMIVEYIVTGKAHPIKLKFLDMIIDDAKLEFRHLGDIMGDVVKRLLRPGDADKALQNIIEDRYGILRKVFDVEDFATKFIEHLESYLEYLFEKSILIGFDSLKFIFSSQTLINRLNLKQKFREAMLENSKEIEKRPEEEGLTRKEAAELAALCLAAEINPDEFLDIIKDNVSDKYAYLHVLRDIRPSRNFVFEILEEKAKAYGERKKQEKKEDKPESPEGGEESSLPKASSIRLLRKIYKLAQLSDKAKENILKHFIEIHKRLGLEFDPEHTLRLIDTWDKLRRSPKTKGLVKPNIYEYKNLRELEDDLHAFRDVSSEEKYLRKLLKKYEVYSDKNQSIYEFRSPAESEMLSLAAKGSRWCIQNQNTAYSYLKEGHMLVLRKFGENDNIGDPIYAVLVKPIEDEEGSYTLEIYDQFDNTLMSIGVKEGPSSRTESLTIDISKCKTASEIWPALENLDRKIDEFERFVYTHEKKEQINTEEFRENVKLLVGDIADALSNIRFLEQETSDVLAKMMSHIIKSYRLSDDSIEKIYRKIDNYVSSSYHINEEEAREVFDRLANSYRRLSQAFDRFLNLTSKNDDLSVYLDNFVVSRVSNLEIFIRRLFELDKDKNLGIIEKEYKNLINPNDYPTFSLYMGRRVVDLEDKFLNNLKELEGSLASIYYTSYVGGVLEYYRSYGQELKRLRSDFYPESLRKDLETIFYSNFTTSLTEEVEKTVKRLLTEAGATNLIEIFESEAEFRNLVSTALLFINNPENHRDAMSDAEKYAKKFGIEARSPFELVKKVVEDISSRAYKKHMASQSGLYRDSDFLRGVFANKLSEVANLITSSFKFMQDTKLASVGAVTSEVDVLLNLVSNSLGKSKDEVIEELLKLKFEESSGGESIDSIKDFFYFSGKLALSYAPSEPNVALKIHEKVLDILKDNREKVGKEGFVFYGLSLVGLSSVLNKYPKFAKRFKDSLTPDELSKAETDLPKAYEELDKTIVEKYAEFLKGYDISLPEILSLLSGKESKYIRAYETAFKEVFEIFNRSSATSVELIKHPVFRKSLVAAGVISEEKLDEITKKIKEKSKLNELHDFIGEVLRTYLTNPNSPEIIESLDIINAILDKGRKFDNKNLLLSIAEKLIMSPIGLNLEVIKADPLRILEKLFGSKEKFIEALLEKAATYIDRTDFKYPIVLEIIKGFPEIKNYVNIVNAFERFLYLRVFDINVFGVDAEIKDLIEFIFGTLASNPAYEEDIVTLAKSITDEVKTMILNVIEKYGIKVGSDKVMKALKPEEPKEQIEVEKQSALKKIFSKLRRR